MVNIGSLSTGGRVIAVKADLAKIALTTPVCTEVLEKIALSRRCAVEIFSWFGLMENLYFQDRQALEVDRLGSDQKRNPCETYRASVGVLKSLTTSQASTHMPPLISHGGKNNSPYKRFHGT